MVKVFNKNSNVKRSTGKPYLRHCKLAMRNLPKVLNRYKVDVALIQELSIDRSGGV